MRRFFTLLDTTDEVVDKATEVDVGKEARVEVVTLAMVVKTMEEESLRTPESTISLTRSREEKLADQMTKETLLLVITVVLSSTT